MLAIFFVLVYNVTLLAGTAYLVTVYNWSGWWFLLTLCCLTEVENIK
jgi:hypothetical protein